MSAMHRMDMAKATPGSSPYFKMIFIVVLNEWIFNEVNTLTISSPLGAEAHLELPPDEAGPVLGPLRDQGEDGAQSPEP